jgi:hypothetical protein
MEDGSGWFADPEVEGQERYFDGSEWTTETRANEPDTPPLHLPDHVPELQRALAAATADIDEVESRLGKLFDRAEGDAAGPGASPVSRKAAAAAAAGSPAPAQPAPEVRGDLDEDDDEPPLGTAAGEDDALADLDEALATEEPEKLPKRGLFRRRA